LICPSKETERKLFHSSYGRKGRGKKKREEEPRGRFFSAREKGVSSPLPIENLASAGRERAALFTPVLNKGVGGERGGKENFIDRGDPEKKRSIHLCRNGNTIFRKKVPFYHETREERRNPRAPREKSSFFLT